MQHYLGKYLEIISDFCRGCQLLSDIDLGGSLIGAFFLAIHREFLLLGKALRLGQIAI